MERQFHHGHSQGHFEGPAEDQLQTGFDTFVMTGDMIIKTTPKLAAPSTRLKHDKPASAVFQIGDHTYSDELSQGLPQPPFNGGVEEVPPTEVAGYPRFTDIPVELDIPPDDISSEDERYRIDCSEDLDIANLPPPPAEFLGDFSDTCPTSLSSGVDDGVPVRHGSGLPDSVGPSGNWRNSLDDAIMRLESDAASSEIWTGREVPWQHGNTSGPGIGLTTEKVSSTGRANSSGILVSAAPGVRASKSQENWLQCGGSGGGFVNIDVDAPSASIEALHCTLQSTSPDNLDNLLLRNKSDETVMMRQLADDVRHRDPGVSDNSELVWRSANEERLGIEAHVDSSGAYYNENHSPEHTFSGGFHNIEESRHSSGQRLLGGGKSSPVRRPPPFPNGTDSFAEVNHHIPGNWNHTSDTSRSQLKDADHPSACRLAKRLYHLDGFRKSDVSKHLSKKYTYFCFSSVNSVARSASRCINRPESIF